MLSRFFFTAQAASPQRATFWHLVSRKPLILYIQGPLKPLVLVHKMARGKRMHILRGPIGCEDHPRYAGKWKRYFSAARRLFPEHEVVFLCNTTASRDAFAHAGLPCVFFNQNSLLDENVYRIIPDVPKEFDAVYNAQMEKVKRHYLAARIQSLALITYRIDSQPGYYRRIRKELGHASWLNFGSGRWEWLPDTQVSYHLNRARVGLILSEAEGANYASVEYLLCGLPVVSTESRGGRSVFFEEEYASIVHPSPEAVAEAVKEMIARRIDPSYIRERTIQKMEAHREVFRALLQRICDAEGGSRNISEEWPSLFFNKLLGWRRLGELEGLLQAA